MGNDPLTEKHIQNHPVLLIGGLGLGSASTRAESKGSFSPGASSSVWRSREQLQVQHLSAHQLPAKR